MARQVLANARPGAPVQRVETGTGDGGPSVVLAEIGPVTAAGFAFAAGISRYEAAAWLERMTAEGYVHRDGATGRYAAWCAWPREAAIAVRSAPRRRAGGGLRRAAADAWEKVLGFIALAWFGLMADHSLWLSDDSAYSLTAPLWMDESEATPGGRR